MTNIDILLETLWTWFAAWWWVIPIAFVALLMVQYAIARHRLRRCEKSFREDSEFKAEERKRAGPMYQLMGEPVAVNDNVLQECITKNSFSPVAFKLYEEAMKVLTVCSCTYSSSTPEECALPRNQAICAGLLLRIVSVMRSVATLVIHTPNCANVVFALNRFITESATNLRFLAVKREERFFDQFVRFSLAPERELYDVIRKNIADRDGEMLPIEQRMLRSIDRVCRLSGVTINKVQPKAGNWGGSLRDRLIALGEDESYAMQQRIPSHSVHGTWVDLINHHLTVVDDNGFRPKPDQARVDSRLMLPVCVLALKAAHTYIEVFIPPLPERESLLERITDLTQRIITLDEAHEGWINS